MAGPVRLPIVYVDDTLEFVWTDIHDELAVPAHFIGQGPTDQNVVTNTIDEVVQAIDVLSLIDFMAGGATVSSQGVFKWVPVFNDTGAVATIDRADYELLGYDIGTDRRVTEVDIGFNDLSEEKQYFAADAVLDAFAGLGTGEPAVIGDRLSEWFPTETLPDIIGPRLVNHFGGGVSKIRIRCRTPRPFLELGDAVVVEDDRFVGFDPITQSPLRGNVFRTGRVVGIHDIFGRELTVWVESFRPAQQASPPAQNFLGPARIARALYPGEDFRPARWAVDYAEETGAGGNLQKVKMDWVRFAGSLTATARMDNQSPRCVLPLPLIEGMHILDAAMVVEIPAGTLDVELVRHPIDGSPREVLATFQFTDTVGRTTERVAEPNPGHRVDDSSTYTVEATVPDLDDGESFSIYAFVLLIRELLR